MTWSLFVPSGRHSTAPSKLDPRSATAPTIAPRCWIHATVAFLAIVEDVRRCASQKRASRRSQTGAHWPTGQLFSVTLGDFVFTRQPNHTSNPADDLEVEPRRAGARGSRPLGTRHVQTGGFDLHAATLTRVGHRDRRERSRREASIIAFGETLCASRPGHSSAFMRSDRRWATAAWVRCTPRTIRGSRRDVAIKVLPSEASSRSRAPPPIRAGSAGGRLPQPSQHPHGS